MYSRSSPSNISKSHFKFNKEWEYVNERCKDQLWKFAKPIGLPASLAERKRPTFFPPTPALLSPVETRGHILDSGRFKRKFVQTLDDLRTELGFKIFGYVLMPEHCHLLLWPSPAANPSQIMQKL